MTSVFKRTTPLESQPSKRSDCRATTRYTVRSPLRYRGANSALNAAWKYGRTLDMSAGGILIDIPEAMAVGTKLELAMNWTGLYHNKQSMRLHMIAAVTRTDGRGTALRILKHRFCDAGPAAVRPQRAEKRLAVA
jgi:hypothetical protein